MDSEVKRKFISIAIDFLSRQGMGQSQRGYRHKKVPLAGQRSVNEDAGLQDRFGFLIQSSGSGNLLKKATLFKNLIGSVIIKRSYGG
jgi:hypothetical protein